MERDGKAKLLFAFGELQNPRHDTDRGHRDAAGTQAVPPVEDRQGGVEGLPIAQGLAHPHVDDV